MIPKATRQGHTNFIWKDYLYMVMLTLIFSKGATLTTPAKIMASPPSSSNSLTLSINFTINFPWPLSFLSSTSGSSPITTWAVGSEPFSLILSFSELNSASLERRKTASEDGDEVRMARLEVVMMRPEVHLLVAEGHTLAYLCLIISNELPQGIVTKIRNIQSSTLELGEPYN